jgi:hypothetical protein
MDSIDFALDYDTDAHSVMQAFWRAERWPGLTGHVTGIDIHHEDEQIQVLTMRVETRGAVAAFRTMRCRQRNRIYYFQPAPPPFLLVHGGWWEINPRAHGCTVLSHHEYRVDTAQATQFASTVLGWDGQGPVAARIGELLRANSRQTMEALRRALQTPAASLAT